MLQGTCGNHAVTQRANLSGATANIEPPTPTPTPIDIGSVRFLVIRDGMALVPAALAVYGCDKELDNTCADSDVDITIVYNDAYLIDKMETNWGDYRKCVDEGACPTNDCLSDPSALDALPAGCVRYEDAAAYCKWADKRMPTDLEWERAARGINGLTFPWGDDWCDTCLNWSDNGAFDGSIDGYAGAAPVDSFPSGQSPYGVLNMSGNAWELTRDATEDGGTEITYIRGGGYYYAIDPGTEISIPNLYKTMSRYPLDPPDLTDPSVGFRCAADPTYE